MEATSIKSLGLTGFKGAVTEVSGEFKAVQGCYHQAIVVDLGSYFAILIIINHSNNDGVLGFWGEES